MAINEKLSQLKTLNNSLIDKQMEAQQKLILERQSSTKYRECNTQLKLEIENYNIKISKLESEIESEKEKHKLSKTKKQIGEHMKKQKIMLKD